MTRRRTLLAALIAAPALVAAVGLSALEAWRAVRPRSPLFAPPFAYSLADAIAAGNLQRAYQYIRAGQDPNQPVALRHPALTRNGWVLASPLQWAAANGQADAVRMLLGFGARVDPAAVCLADALEHDDIARYLRTHGGDAGAVKCDSQEMYPFHR